MVVYVVLVFGVVAGLVALIIGATSNDSKSKTVAAGPAWSKWQPQGATLNSITENIARHVSQKYENLGVSALPVSRNPIANEPPIVAVEFRSRFGTFQQPRRLAIHLASRMWMYELCGQNSNCGITSGSGALPSRLNYLVGKEMLELALYTLKYAPKLDSVLIVLPGSDSSPAFYLRRQTAAPALENPVEETIPPGTDELDHKGTDLLAKRLWLLNANQIRQLPDTSIILELDKPPAQGKLTALDLPTVLTPAAIAVALWVAIGADDVRTGLVPGLVAIASLVADYAVWRRRKKPWHDPTVITLLLPALAAALWIGVGGILLDVERSDAGLLLLEVVPGLALTGLTTTLISYHGRHEPTRPPKTA